MPRTVPSSSWFPSQWDIKRSNFWHERLETYHSFRCFPGVRGHWENDGIWGRQRTLPRTKFWRLRCRIRKEGCWKNFLGRESLSRNLSGQVLFSIIGFRMENDAKSVQTREHVAYAGLCPTFKGRGYVYVHGLKLETFSNLSFSWSLAVIFIMCLIEMMYSLWSGNTLKSIDNCYHLYRFYQVLRSNSGPL